MRQKSNFTFSLRIHIVPAPHMGSPCPSAWMHHATSAVRKGQCMHWLFCRLLVSWHCSEFPPLYHIQQKLLPCNLFTFGSTQSFPSFAFPYKFKYLLVTLNKISIVISVGNGTESIYQFGEVRSLIFLFINKNSSSFVLILLLHLNPQVPSQAFI